MKISHIKTWIVFNGFWRNWVFVKMETDEGIYGIGEASLEGKEHSVVAAISELSSYLVGKDPTDIEHHWQVMYRGCGWKGGPVLGSAISGLEICMWDILGKVAGLPVYKLLGGACRDKVHVYTHIDEPMRDKNFIEKNKDAYIPYDELYMRMTPEWAVKNALLKIKQGYDGLKTLTIWNQHWHTVSQKDFDNAVDIFAAVREAVGKDVDLYMHEFANNYNPSTAIKLAKAIEPYNPFWFEEPVAPENIDAMVLVARGTSVPIATGERLFYKYGFRELLEKHACAVINPDPIHDGGIMETKKIAAMAEAYEIDVATHNPYSPVAKAVNLHLAACIPNFIRLEWESPEIGNERKNIGLECVKIIGWDFKVENSWVKIPTAPGLGVDLNEEALEKYTYQQKGMGSIPPYFSRYLAYTDLSMK